MTKYPTITILHNKLMQFKKLLLYYWHFKDFPRFANDTHLKNIYNTNNAKWKYWQIRAKARLLARKLFIIKF